jgi:hypothetical protein
MNEGSVFRRADGKWCAKWKDATGTWRYLYRKSKAEAKKALRQALKDRDEGIIPPTKTTVGVMLDEWLQEIRENGGPRRSWPSLMLEQPRTPVLGTSVNRLLYTCR